MAQQAATPGITPGEISTEREILGGVGLRCQQCGEDLFVRVHFAAPVGTVRVDCACGARNLFESTSSGVTRRYIPNFARPRARSK